MKGAVRDLRPLRKKGQKGRAPLPLHTRGGVPKGASMLLGAVLLRARELYGLAAHTECKLLLQCWGSVRPARAGTQGVLSHQRWSAKNKVRAKRRHGAKAPAGLLLLAAVSRV